MPKVTICICTFRRESVADTLASLAHIENPRDVAEIVVVDNDDEPSARARIESAGKAADLPLRYVHAPARNISIARNAALDAVGTRWAAFIDDDEVALPGWLGALLASSEGVNAVIGQSRALYGPALPGWTAACDFHSNRIEKGADNAYTSNALLDIAFVREKGLRFSEELGQTGGEDTLFFRQMAHAGGRIVYQPDSVVEEEVPPGRATMKWVLRRHYRSGQTHGLVLRTLNPAAYRKLPLTASAKLAVCAAMALVNLPRGAPARRWLARGTLHAGALSFVVRPRMLREYASA